TTSLYTLSLHDALPISSFLNLNEHYGKQLLFIILSVILIILILSVEAKFYERFSSVIYLICIVLLAGLFLFGKNINGATSWYSRSEEHTSELQSRENLV